MPVQLAAYRTLCAGYQTQIPAASTPQLCPAETFLMNFTPLQPRLYLQEEDTVANHYIVPMTDIVTVYFLNHF